MNTFTNIRARLHASREIALEGPAYVVFDVGEQRIRVVERPALGISWLVVASVICPQELVEHYGALTYNRFHDGVGFIAIERGCVQLRVQVPMRSVDDEALDVLIDHVATESARLRVRAVPERSFIPELFCNFTD